MTNKAQKMAEYSILKGLNNNASEAEIILQIDSGNADMNEVDTRGIPVLIYAIEWKLHELTNYLVQKGIELTDLSFYVSALTWNVKLVEEHLNRGIHPNLKYMGYTPLMTAIAALDRHKDDNLYPNLIKITSLLLEKGADVSLANDEMKQTALHFAAHYGKKELIEMIVAKGADFYQEDAQGFSALHHICVGGHNVMGLQYLMDLGADINYQDSQFGRTALHVAVLFYRFNAVVLLRKLGADEEIGTTKDLPFYNEQPHFDLVFPIGTRAQRMARKLEMDDIANFLLDNGDWGIELV